MSEYTVGGYDIKDIQNVMLDILTLIDGICRKYNIRYILDGGSMLGAVRHGGFIPWDDDADIMMPRDDYERFTAIAETELGDGYVFQCIENTPKYPYNFGKVFKTSTLYAENFTKDLPICHGIYVDIFPMDYVSEKNYLRHAKMTGHYTQLRYYKLGIAKTKKPIPLFALPVSLINKGADRHMKYYGKDKKKLCKLCHHGKNKPPVDVSIFDDVIETDFEGHKFFIPAEYDSFLKGRYGSYTELPPEEKRKPCHNLIEVVL